MDYLSVATKKVALVERWLLEGHVRWWSIQLVVVDTTAAPVLYIVGQ